MPSLLSSQQMADIFLFSTSTYNWEKKRRERKEEKRKGEKNKHRHSCSPPRSFLIPFPLSNARADIRTFFLLSFSISNWCNILIFQFPTYHLANQHTYIIIYLHITNRHLILPLLLTPKYLHSPIRSAQKESLTNFPPDVIITWFKKETRLDSTRLGFLNFQLFILSTETYPPVVFLGSSTSSFVRLAPTSLSFVLFIN